MRLIVASRPYMYLFRILRYYVLCWVIVIELLLFFFVVFCTTSTGECYFVKFYLYRRGQVSMQALTLLYPCSKNSGSVRNIGLAQREGQS